MPKWSSYITRFLLLMALSILGMTVLFYGMSSYLFNEIYMASNYSVLTENITAASSLLQKYQDGRLEREDLNRAVNPALNVDGDFYMLLDGDKKVVAYTERSSPKACGRFLTMRKNGLIC